MVRCDALQRNYPSSWGMRHRGNNKCGFTTAKKLVGTRRMGVGASASRGFQWIAPEIVCLGRRWCQARQSQQERHLTTTLADLPWRSPWLASRWSPLVHNHWVDPEFHRSVQIMCLTRPERESGLARLGGFRRSAGAEFRWRRAADRHALSLAAPPTTLEYGCPRARVSGGNNRDRLAAVREPRINQRGFSYGERIALKRCKQCDCS